jgi:hypothetical protein
MAYLDDIIIFSVDLDEHKDHVRKTLDKLLEAKMYMNPRKCEFHTQRTEFLGFIIEPGRIKIDPKKVEEVLKWETPKNLTDVQSFIGFCNFCRQLILNWSELAEPLTQLMRKDCPFEWTPEREQAFQEIKKRFAEDPIIYMFNPELPAHMESDASNHTIAAVLLQFDENGTKRPVAYFSRKMTPAELNYDIHDKELLAIVKAFKEWRPYLQGANFPTIVYTDHKNLTGFMETKELVGRQIRWAQKLATYDFKIVHTAGSLNKRADALTRRPGMNPETTVTAALLRKEADGTIVYNHPKIAASLETITLPNNILEWIREASTEADDELAHMDKETRDGLITIFQRIYIPQKIRKEFVRRFHELPAHGHQGIEKTLARLMEQYYIPKARQVVTEVLRECADCQRNRHERHAPYGLLQPTEPAERIWETISMDFIVKLPPSRDPLTQRKYDAILVIVEKLTRYSYFLPYLEASNGEQLAYTLLRHIVSSHGLPKKIISDRDPKFTSHY